MKQTHLYRYLFSLALVLVLGMAACNGEGSPLESLQGTLAFVMANVTPEPPAIAPIVPIVPIVPVGGATATETPAPDVTLSGTASDGAVTPIVLVPVGGNGTPGDDIGEPNAFINATSANINMRSGPGTNYGVVEVVEDGAAVTVAGRNEAASWGNVFLEDGTEGWIFANLLTLDVGVELADFPIVEAPPPPVAADVSTPEPPGEGTPTASESSGPLEASWFIVGTPIINADNSATHTIMIDARGGNGDYTYYRDGLLLPGNTFQFVWTLCESNALTSVTVISGDGQEVEVLVAFRSFCPTPVGCSDCTPWSP